MTRLRIVAASVALALALTGCGGTDGSDDGVRPAPQELSDTEQNAADVDFAAAMIPHHAEALVMVDLTQGRTLDPAMQTLVEDIRAVQTAEIETMTDWLVDWGEEVPATIRDHANAGHGYEGLAGDLGALEQASDATFQPLWLEMMAEHHREAVEMAREEQAAGRYRPAVELAEQIVDTQTEEIETMQGMLPS